MFCLLARHTERGLHMKPDPRVTVVFAGSAVLLAIAGLTCLFLPDFVAPRLGGASASTAPIQLTAAGLLGFAALDWIGRNAIYGGIYGRPIVLANFLHGMILTTTLIRLQATPSYSLIGMFAAILAGAYTVLFAVLLFRGPKLVDD
jgi:hypothetical protein